MTCASVNEGQRPVRGGREVAELYPTEAYPVDVAQQTIDSIEAQGGLSEVCHLDMS